MDIQLPGRFLTHIGDDASLSTINLSCSGALVQSSTLPDPGAELVCYFDDLGRVVATVVRHTGEGFALSFNVASHKREKIADRLTILDKGHILMIGTVDEVRKSKNERVQNLLNRMPEDDTIDPDEYLGRLTGEEIGGDATL